MANIGKSISIKGDLTGNEDLVIEGKVEGKVELPNNQLTVGANGVVKAEISAKTVVVIGRVAGNVKGSERIEIQATGIVEGDVAAPRLVVAEGAVVNGSIQMTKQTGAAAGTSAAGLPPRGAQGRLAASVAPLARRARNARTLPRRRAHVATPLEVEEHRRRDVDRRERPDHDSDRHGDRERAHDRPSHEQQRHARQERRADRQDRAREGLVDAAIQHVDHVELRVQRTCSRGCGRR